MRATLAVVLLFIALVFSSSIAAHKSKKRISDHPSVVIPYGGSGIRLTANDSDCFQWYVIVLKFLYCAPLTLL